MLPDRDPFQSALSKTAGSRDSTTQYFGQRASYGVPTSDAPGSQFFGPPDDINPTLAEGGYFSSISPWLPQAPLNTYAVLALIFGVLVPPAGAVLGHLALPQIRRTGQRGWLAAVCGLVIGYLLSVVLLVLMVWLTAVGARGSDGAAASQPSGVRTAAAPPSLVTSIAPAPIRPHIKLDLNQATVGKCVELEKRDEASEGTRDDALDLYEVPCQHRVGVYTVVARVPGDAECNSTYVASPPDRSFTVCLNRY